MINGFLKPPYFINESHKAETEGSQSIFHLDRRLLTKDRTLPDAEADHFVQPLVHHLRGEPWTGPKTSRSRRWLRMGRHSTSTSVPVCPTSSNRSEEGSTGGATLPLRLSLM